MDGQARPDLVGAPSAGASLGAAGVTAEDVIALLPVAVFAIDLEKRVVIWNRACELLTGISGHLVLGQGEYAYAEPFVGERRPILIDLLDMQLSEAAALDERVWTEGDMLCAEAFNGHVKGGRGAYLRARAFRLFDRAGQRCGSVEVVRDISEERRVKRALEEGQERLLQAQRVADVGFFDWDLRSNDFFVSEQICSMTGYFPPRRTTTPEFVARTVHPDDLAYVRENLSLAFRNQKPYDVVYRHVRPDGAVVWVHGQAELTRDADGRAVRMLGTLVNVTRQKEAEQALRESELKYRTLFEGASEAIILMRGDRCIDCNAGTLAMFGCSREDIIGASPEEFSPPVQPDGRPSREAAREKLELTLADGPQYGEWEYRRTDGSRFPAEVSLNRIELGSEVLVQAIMRDVTTRKAREDALREREAHLSSILNNVSDVIFVVAVEPDDEYRFVLVNRRFREATGLAEGQVVGRRVGDVIPQSARELVLGKYHEALRSGGAVHWEETSEYPSGLKTGHVTLVPVYDAAGAFTQLVGLVHDVTERKRAEEQVRQLNEDLKRHADELEQRVQARTAQLALRNQELKDFAYTVSHDLKAPLRGIAGYANELVRKHSGGLSARGQFCLTQILTAATNLDRLIEDLLHYSRLDAETPSPTQVNVRRLVESVLRDRQLAIAEQHTEVSLDIPFEAVRTWQQGLMHVLVNLIDNALKYSRKSSPPRVHISAAILDGEWKLTVNDNGIGFDMKYHDRIFGLFNRLVRMDEYEGTGAGLAIVRKVVEKQGGRIWAESKPGEGATFFVTIPLSRDSNG